MAGTMLAMSATGVVGLGKFSSQCVGQKIRARAAVARAVASSSSPESKSRCCDTTRPLQSLSSSSLFQDVPKESLRGAETWIESISNREWGKTVAPIVASAAFYLQASAPTLAEVVEVDNAADVKFTAALITSGVCGIIYLFIAPAIIYNYLRLRWYKRNAAEAYFQFMLVFIFFPGMLLLAPFINFRRLPKKGTEPP